VRWDWLFTMCLRFLEWLLQIHFFSLMFCIWVNCQTMCSVRCSCWTDDNGYIYFSTLLAINYPIENCGLILITELNILLTTFCPFLYFVVISIFSLYWLDFPQMWQAGLPHLLHILWYLHIGILDWCQMFSRRCPVYSSVGAGVLCIEAGL